RFPVQRLHGFGDGVPGRVITFLHVRVRRLKAFLDGVFQSGHSEPVSHSVLSVHLLHRTPPVGSSAGKSGHPITFQSFPVADNGRNALTHGRNTGGTRAEPPEAPPGNATDAPRTCRKAATVEG